jgi:hypothetical protein
VEVAGFLGDQLFLNALAKFLLTIFGMIIIYTIESQWFRLRLGYIIYPKCSLNLFEAPALAQMLTHLNGVEYFRLTKRGVLRSAHESKQLQSSSSSWEA